jgi:hypothetical protein
VLASRLEALIQRYPTFVYRRLWAWLRFREGCGSLRGPYTGLSRSRAGSCTSDRSRRALELPAWSVGLISAMSGGPPTSRMNRPEFPGELVT